MLHGTISHGTHRPQDLIPAFLDALRTVNPAAYDQLTLGSGHPPIPSYALEDEDAEWWETEDCGYVLEDVREKLEESAPEGTYFGTLEGDGTDFGFWPLESDEA
jgi:hypothetical protein